MIPKNISIIETAFPLRLGTSVVKLHIMSSHSSQLNPNPNPNPNQNLNLNLNLLNLHSDETTAIEVGKAFLQNHQGTFSYLNHNQTRNINFRLNHQEICFDPNRMFSKSGIIATLKETKSFSKEALKVIDSFSKNLLNHLNVRKGPVVALHNNQDPDFSIHSFQKKGEYGEDSQSIFIAPEQSAHDFFYVINEKNYRSIKNLGMNVVLQDNDNVRDDGSLSFYCSQHDIEYINIESKLNHFKSQLEMLQKLALIENIFN